MKFLGFILPFDVSDISADMPRDSRPVAGLCVLCKRQSPVTYLRGDGRRVCDTDIDETFGMRDVRRARGRRAVTGAPERVPTEPAGLDWWNRHFS